MILYSLLVFRDLYRPQEIGEASNARLQVDQTEKESLSRSQEQRQLADFLNQFHHPFVQKMEYSSENHLHLH